MLGVPPKSSGGATNRCVMSRLTKCAVLDPFQTALSQACRARSCRVLRWGRRSATLRSVFAAHGPTSCFSPTRTGVLADLSRCKPLPGIAVNGALVWRQVTAAICGSTSGALAGPDNAGYRWSRHSTFRRLNRGCCEGSDPPSRQGSSRRGRKRIWTQGGDVVPIGSTR